MESGYPCLVRNVFSIERAIGFVVYCIYYVEIYAPCLRILQGFYHSFTYVGPSWHVWDEAILIVVGDLFDVFLNIISRYYIENFYISVHWGDCPIIYFW